jgi:SP family sugar:H+ symporter-like MFS transporter
MRSVPISRRRSVLGRTHISTASNLRTTRSLFAHLLASSSKRKASPWNLCPLLKVNLCRWQQLTGINFIFYYGTTFFNHSGIQNPFVIAIATNVVNVGMTVPGMWGVERFGRRRLLLVGAAGMCICEYIVAIAGVTISVHNLVGQKVLIAFVCIYIVSLSHRRS